MDPNLLVVKCIYNALAPEGNGLFVHPVSAVVSFEKFRLIKLYIYRCYALAFAVVFTVSIDQSNPLIFPLFYVNEFMTLRR